MFSRRFAISSAAVAVLGAGAAELPAQTAAEGEAVYERRCASCHRPGSRIAAPELGAAVSYSHLRFRAQVRAGVDLPEPQADMPAFPRTVISDRDICALYLHVRAGRPDAAGESATACGYAPPADPSKKSGDGSSAPPPPPAPPNPALDASRPHFAPARNATYRLDCRGGDSASAAMLSGGDGRTSEHIAWRYQIEFVELRTDASLRRGSCIWVGPAPAPRASGAYRVRMEWNSALSPAFQTLSYRAIDNAVRVDSDRRLLYPAIYREIIEAVSRPDATFAFEVWYPPAAGTGRVTTLQVSAAAVRLGTR